MTTYIILALAAFFAAFIHALSGFAFGMIFLGIILHVLPYTQVVALCSILGWILTAYATWTFRKSIVWKILPISVASYIVCSKIGIMFLDSISNLDLLQKIAAILLVVWAINMFVKKKQLKFPYKPLYAVIWGGAAGLMGALFGMAPIFAIYFMAITETKEEYMGTLQAQVMISILFELFFRAQQGMITTETVYFAAFATIFLLAGFIIGKSIMKKITFTQLHKIVYGIVLVCGIFLLV